MKRRAFTIGEAIDQFLLNLEEPKMNPKIKQPIAFALHKTWLWFANNEMERSGDYNCNVAQIEGLIKESTMADIGVSKDGLWYLCGQCGGKMYCITGANGEYRVIPDELPKYCPRCGKKVKWE